MYTRPPSGIQPAYHRRQKSTESDKTSERLCNYRKPARPRHVGKRPRFDSLGVKAVRAIRQKLIHACPGSRVFIDQQNSPME